MAGAPGATLLSIAILALSTPPSEARDATPTIPLEPGPVLMNTPAPAATELALMETIPTNCASRLSQLSRDDQAPPTDDSAQAVVDLNPLNETLWLSDPGGGYYG